MNTKIFLRKARNAPKVLVIWPLMRVFGYVKGTFLMKKIVKNWWVYPMSLLGLLPANNLNEFHYNNGLDVLFRPNTYDALINCDIFGYEEYGDFVNLHNKFTNIIDIGAQTGVFTLFFLSRMKGKAHVTCVEAIKENFDILKTNIERNGFVDQVRLINMAAWSESGKIIEIYKNNSNTGGHSILNNNPKVYKEKETVRTISLKDIVGNIDCDLLKVDIEGSEYELILKAEKETLDKIHRIVMEVHGSEDTNISLKRFLENLGFKVRLLMPHLYAER